MSAMMPVVGQDPWGDTLNAYLTSLEERIEALEANSHTEYIYNSYSWKFTVPPADASGELCLNNANAALATQIDVRKIDSDGADRTPVFQQVTLNDQIRVNDWDNAAVIHRFKVTGTPTIGATNVTIPVAWLSGNGALPTSGAAKINVGFLLSISI